MTEEKFNFENANIYTLNVNIESDTSSYTVKDESGNSHFKKMDYKRSPKIYMLANTDKYGTVCYVGQTITGMKTRLDSGIVTRAKNSKNYSWAYKSGKYHLFVWNIKTKGIGSSYDLDRIESELVFAVRANQKYYPTYQTTIKFRHISQSGDFKFLAPRIAQAMMDNYYKFLKNNAKGNVTLIDALEKDRVSLDEILDRCTEGK